MSRGYSYTNGTFTKSVDDSVWEIVSANAFVEIILVVLLLYLILRAFQFVVLIMDVIFTWLEPRPNSVGIRRSMDSLPLWLKVWVILFVIVVVLMLIASRSDPHLTVYTAVIFAMVASTFHTFFWGKAFKYYISKGYTYDKLSKFPFFPKRGKRIRTTAQCVLSWVIFEASLFFAEAKGWVELIPL